MHPLLDFEARSAASSGAAELIEPWQIFTTLARDPRFKFPSANQGEVLDKWLEKRARRDTQGSG